MRILDEFVDRERAELREHGVRVRVFGDRSRLSDEARQSIRLLEESTADGETMSLNLAISYGSRDEIIHATRSLAAQVAEGKLDAADIDADRFARELYTADCPDPDLLVRTSGEMRVSNFLLWQIAYAEIHVTPVLWPDFGREEFVAAIADFQGRERRFGGVTA